MAFHDWISTLGVSLILLAFVLVTFKQSTPDKPIILLLNFVGAGLACWGAALLPSYPFIILEATWSIVALLGLIRAITRSK